MPESESSNAESGPEARGPLDGLRVVDATTTFMGPYATFLLAYLGASVIKVEAPGGDPPRYIGQGRSDGMGPIFLNANTGKRSVVLDLSAPGGQEALNLLLQDADVFVHNMRPAAASKLGIDGPRLLAHFPQLVHCCLRGFGDGPYAGRAAYDDVIQAMCGLASVQHVDGLPQYVASPLIDKMMGIVGAMSILAAVNRRHATGRGESVTVPMFEFMTSWMMLEQQGGRVFDPPLGPTGYPRTSSPHRRPYETRDGYISVMLYTDRQWTRFFKEVGREDLATDPRFTSITGRTANIDILYTALAQELSKRTTDEWMTFFDRSSIAAAKVQSIEDLFADPHLREVGFWKSVRHPSEGRLTLSHPSIAFSNGIGNMSPAPRLGEHTVQVLTEFGATREDIDALLACGAAHQAKLGDR